MLVYDVTHEKSFDNIRNWIRNIEEVCAVFEYLFVEYMYHTVLVFNFTVRFAWCIDTQPF